MVAGAEGTLDNSPQFMQNSRPPSLVHRVVIANITELTTELTNARLHVARHDKAWNGCKR